MSVEKRSPPEVRKTTDELDVQFCYSFGYRQLLGVLYFSSIGLVMMRYQYTSNFPIRLSSRVLLFGTTHAHTREAGEPSHSRRSWKQTDLSWCMCLVGRIAQPRPQRKHFTIGSADISLPLLLRVLAPGTR
eukprot:1889511-Pyramimonas_sp.AAC.1